MRISESWIPADPPAFDVSALDNDALGRYSREMFGRDYSQLTDSEANAVWNVIERHSK